MLGQAAPPLVCVCIPPDDEYFRIIVESAVDAAGPGAHVVQEGLSGVVALVKEAYPDVAVRPVILAEPESGAPRQIWWYIHRDGEPERVM